MLKLDFWWLLGVIINVVTVVYLLSKITGRKLNFKDWKFYVFSILLFVIIAVNSVFVTSNIRILISTLVIILYCYAVIEKNINKSIIATLIEQMIMFVAEMTVIIVIMLMFANNTNSQLQIMVGKIYANIIISIVAILVIRIPLIKKFYNKVNSIIDNITTKMKYLYVLLFIMTLNVFLSLIYYNNNVIYAIVINLLFIIIYSIIMYVALKEKNENLQFKIKNTELMNNLKGYEKMLDYQRITNHENKNQLLVVKNMVQKKEKGVVEYIDEIIKDTRKDNDSLYNKAKRIPSGGLQGIIYQKMLLMEDEKIRLWMDIDNNLKEIDFSKLTSKNNYDLCRIVGVFLDNAIEEVKKLKQKAIDLNLHHEDGYLIVEISNVFEGDLNLEKIDNVGFSTKGDGHGYGLSLVKEIVNNNDNIINERAITGNVFTQIVKIKM